jgi:HEAT repeat protein
MSLTRLVPALLLPALLALGSPARGQDEDPPYRGKKLSEWLEMLQNGKDVDTRRAGLIAVELIGPRKSRKVIPALTGALRTNTEPKVRAGAALALGRIAGKARPEDDLRLDDIRTALEAALRTDQSEPVRESAARGLGYMKGEARGSVGVLARALKDPHAGTQTAAADTLRRLGRDAFEALAELQAVVKDPKVEVATRVHCAHALGRIGAPDAVPAVPTLKEVLADTKAPGDLRKAAAEALGELGRDASDAVPVLAAALTAADADTSLRRECADALDRMGPEARPALAALLKALKDDDKFVRSRCLHTIGQMGKVLGTDSKAAVTAVLVCTDDNVLEVRVAAVEALGNLGPDGLGEQAKAVTDKLTEATRDSQKAVSDAAGVALKKLQGS